MPAWKSLVSLLALASSATSCAHHGDAEVVPEHEREELLKKWDQEVNLSIEFNSIHFSPNQTKPVERKKGTSILTSTL
jgi:hypothetical protein